MLHVLARSVTSTEHEPPIVKKVKQIKCTFVRVIHCFLNINYELPYYKIESVNTSSIDLPPCACVRTKLESMQKIEAISKGMPKHSLVATCVYRMHQCMDM